MRHARVENSRQEVSGHPQPYRKSRSATAVIRSPKAQTFCRCVPWFAGVPDHVAKHAQEPMSIRFSTRRNNLDVQVDCGRYRENRSRSFDQIATLSDSRFNWCAPSEKSINRASCFPVSDRAADHFRRIAN